VFPKRAQTANQSEPRVKFDHFAEHLQCVDIKSEKIIKSNQIMKANY